MIYGVHIDDKFTVPVPAPARTHLDVASGFWQPVFYHQTLMRFWLDGSATVHLQCSAWMCEFRHICTIDWICWGITVKWCAKGPRVSPSIIVWFITFIQQSVTASQITCSFSVCSTAFQSINKQIIYFCLNIMAGKSGRYFEDDLKCIFYIFTVQSIGHPH